MKCLFLWRECRTCFAPRNGKIISYASLLPSFLPSDSAAPPSKHTHLWNQSRSSRVEAWNVCRVATPFVAYGNVHGDSWGYFIHEQLNKRPVATKTSISFAQTWNQALFLWSTVPPRVCPIFSCTSEVCIKLGNIAFLLLRTQFHHLIHGQHNLLFG